MNVHWTLIIDLTPRRNRYTNLPVHEVRGRVAHEASDVVTERHREADERPDHRHESLHRHVRPDNTATSVLAEICAGRTFRACLLSEFRGEGCGGRGDVPWPRWTGTWCKGWRSCAPCRPVIADNAFVSSPYPNQIQSYCRVSQRANKGGVGGGWRQAVATR